VGLYTSWKKAQVFFLSPITLKVLLAAYFLVDVIPFLTLPSKLGFGPSIEKVTSPPKSVMRPA